MRWILLAAALPLAACTQLTPVAQPTDLPGPTPTGDPESSITVAGETWTPCAEAQINKYPPVLVEPAPSYYAGPWCLAADGGNKYMWTYARPLWSAESPEEVRGYVNEDAQLLTRELRTTGYIPLSDLPKEGEDVQFAARRPNSPNTVTVSVVGDNVPPSGQTYVGDDPLRLIVAVRKANPGEEVTPTPSVSPSP